MHPVGTLIIAALTAWPVLIAIWAAGQLDQSSKHFAWLLIPSWFSLSALGLAVDPNPLLAYSMLVSLLAGQGLIRVSQTGPDALHCTRDGRLS